MKTPDAALISRWIVAALNPYRKAVRLPQQFHDAIVKEAVRRGA